MKRRGGLTEEQERRLLEDLLNERSEPIAIIGIGLNLPGNNETPTELSDYLRGECGTSSIPEGRWSTDELSKLRLGNGGTFAGYGGYLEDIKLFDSSFFGISPKEAKYIDPQQRMVLETSWRALEHSGINFNKVMGEVGGVFVGVSSHDYSRKVSSLPHDECVAPIGTGTSNSLVSGRVSYFLDWRGPSTVVDTSCSSSLVAIHQAVLALRRKECSIALSGGVNVVLDPRNMTIYSNANMLSPDGRCKTFDENADGYGRSEGCGMLLLKRLSDAESSGDRIIATILGSAVSHGGRSAGLTVPNVFTQEEVMRQAISNAELLPTDIRVVEAHGTGTILGDPIEVRAINNVFRKSHSRKNPIKVSSIKGNIGHAEAAAGVIGVIKSALQIEKSEIYAHVGMHTPSKHIPWGDYIVDVPLSCEPWNDESRRCLVNSFGFSGSISSLVMGNYSKPAQRGVAKYKTLPSILTVSSKTKHGLERQVFQLLNWASEYGNDDIPRISYAGNMRMHLKFRVSIVFTDICELKKLWKDITEDTYIINTYRRKIVFLFSDVSEYYNCMGLRYWENCPVYRRWSNCCWKDFLLVSGQQIEKRMEGEYFTCDTDMPPSLKTHASTFSLQYSLAMYWLELGVEPDIVMGCGVGELVAVCLAGILNLDDAIKLTVMRCNVLSNDGSTDIDSYYRKFEELEFRTPDLAILSVQMGGGDFTNKDYWIRVPDKVDSIAKVSADLKNSVEYVFMELGPNNSISMAGMVSAPNLNWLHCMEPNGNDMTKLAESVSTVFAGGAPINWDVYHDDTQYEWVEYPGYLFDKKEYWIS